MGIKHNWICTNSECGNEVEPVSGGTDRGFRIKVQTRICKICKKIKDYKVGVVSDPTHQTFTTEELKNHENLNPKCADCSGETIAWDCTCPVCGSPMAHGYTRIMYD